MKICMAGLGSIGKRHIKNIQRVLSERNIEYQIDALRSSERKLPDEVQQAIHTMYYHTEELPDDYDVIFITNPTAKHYETIKVLKDKTKAMFIEKPLFETTAYELENLQLKSDGIYYVACPLRHKAVLKYVKNEILPKEKIFSVRAVSTSYLPEWRAGIDYRNTYSAKKELGGGVTLDLIHEWDYLTYFFGFPEKIFHLSGKYSNLEIDCEDISLYIAAYPDKTAEVHLDYLGRFPERKLELYGEKERIDVDLIHNTICFHGEDKTQEKVLTFEEDDLYVNEMNYFFDLFNGKEENINTPGHAYKVMQLALGEEMEK